MTTEEIVQLVIDLSDGYVSYPFNKNLTQDKVIWHVIKHHHNDKVYGAVFEKDGHVHLNVKLTVEHGQELRQLNGVMAGYHMNKTHWNTILINQTDLTLREIEGVIKESALLTK